MSQGKGKRRKGAAGTRLSSPNRIEFPEVKGRTVETIEFYSSRDCHSVSVRFEDQTELTFDIEIESGLRVSPEHIKWKAGNSRVLKRWPAFRTES